MERGRNKKSKKLIIALAIIIPILLVVIGLVAFCTPLLVTYYKNAYEGRDTAERSEVYEMPETQDELWNTDITSEDEDSYLYELQGTSSETLPGNRFDHSISFGDSSNAISVYGKTPIYKVPQRDSDVFNILVLGTDSRNVTKERGRSDSMIVMSYNKKTGKCKMVSLMRDLLVPIEGHDWNRLNAAYSYDGVGLAVNTVNQIFGLDIQHFAVIDFNGTRNFIDYLGGVDISLTQAEANHYNGNGYLGRKDFKAGPCHMDGAMALYYMRTRYVDSDFGRTERQRKVITTLAKKIIAEKSVEDIYELTDYACKLVKTNIPVTTLASFFGSIAMQGENFSLESQNIPYSDAFSYKTYNGMSIISIDIDATAKRMNKFLYEE
ncbi:MAG: LCP family protein [Clostridia bacterium]|nr:LCP family protein [Clostridia bacterium]